MQVNRCGRSDAPSFDSGLAVVCSKMTVDFSAGLLLLVLPPVGWVVAGIWGALWGSFFNVCIYRIPLFMSVSWPGSRCPRCGTFIAAYDNIPILSWLILRGRCRHCPEPISPRYLLVEALMTGLSLLLYSRFVASGEGPLSILVSEYIVYFYFTGLLVVLSGIDFDHQILPDSITYPAIPIFFVMGRFLPDVSALDALIGMVAGYAFVRLIADGYYYLTGREGMGYGDGKLLAITGGLLGYKSLPLTLLWGSLAGIAVSLPALILRRRSEKRTQVDNAARTDATKDGAVDHALLRHVEVPFGPFLAFGAFCYLLLFIGRDYETVILRLFGGLVLK